MQFNKPSHQKTHSLAAAKRSRFPLLGAFILPRLFIRIMRNFYKIHLLTTLVFGMLSFKTLAHDQPAAYEIINLADDFYSVYQSSKKLSPEKRAERFSQHFTSQFEPFYSNKNFVKSIENFSEIEEVYLLKKTIGYLKI